VRASTNSVNALHAIELYFIIALVVTIKGKVPEIAPSGLSGRPLAPDGVFFLRHQSLPGKTNKENIMGTKNISEPRAAVTTITFEEGQFNTPVIKIRQLTTIINLVFDHRFANEHDHNFGILLPPPAASNEWRRNVPCQRTHRRMEIRNSHPCLAPGNFVDF
jgi:hypothetical protein